MDKMIARFPQQLAEALEIGQAANIRPQSGFKNVYIAGLGGSGIGGNYVAEMVRMVCPVPVIVGKGYDIPNFIDKDTLAIISSYSGNTEETLMALSQISQKGARIVCISSGGKLIEFAKENECDYIQVPDNWSSPRACLGYSIIQQLFILNKLGLVTSRFVDRTQTAISLLENDTDEIKAQAKSIAEKIYDKTPVIYAMDRFEPVAIRLRQQINENAKMLCWHHVLPEMNHNELVGWKDDRQDTAVLVLRSPDDYDRNQTRLGIMQGIVSNLSADWIELFAKGESKLEQYFYLTHLSDWISFYLAEKRQVDPVEIDVINHLKSELAKSPF